MKVFNIIIVLILLIGGIITYITFNMIANGISDPTKFDKIYNIAVISEIIVFLAILCLGIKTFIVLYQQDMRR